MTTATDRFGACRHDVTVRRVMFALFAGEAKAAFVGRSLATAASTTWSSAYDIRFAVAEAMEFALYMSPSNKRTVLLGKTELRLIVDRAADENDDSRIVDGGGCSSVETARIAGEVLLALRRVFAVQRESHDRDDASSPAMAHWTCKQRELPAVETRVSGRYWQDVAYWLCDIMSLVCETFDVRVVNILAAATTSSLTRALDLTYAERSRCRVLACVLRWRWRVLFRRDRGATTRACKSCAFEAYQNMDRRDLTSLTTTSRNAAIKLFVIAHNVSLYREALSECELFDICERHGYIEEYMARRYFDIGWVKRSVSTVSCDVDCLVGRIDPYDHGRDRYERRVDRRAIIRDLAAFAENAQNQLHMRDFDGRIRLRNNH